MGDAAKAAGYAERAVAAVADSADYRSNLGRYYLSLGRVEQARASLERAVELNPRHALGQFNLACALEAAGRKEESAACFQRYTELVPEDPGGYHKLGGVLADLRRPLEAAHCFRRVIALNGLLPEAHNNLGNSLQAAGKAEEAIPCYRRALELRPGYAEAASNLGAALQATGKLDEAGVWYEEALRIEPGLIPARGNIGNLLAARGRHLEAIAQFEAILAEAPDSAETWNNSGNSYQETGQYEQALAAYQRALAINPAYHAVHNNIGNTLRRQGRYQEALAHYQKALEEEPGFVEALNNLAVVLQDLGRGPEAVELFEKALALRATYIDPLINLSNYWRDHARPQLAIRHLEQALAIRADNPYVWNNLGCALGDVGRVEEGIRCFRNALALGTGNSHAHGNVVLNMHYLASYSPEEIFAEHLALARLHATPLEKLQRRHENDPDPGRRLRIGYVSADFRRHSVAFFLEPVLERHNRSEVEVYCYSDTGRPDAYTARLQSLVGNTWRDIRGFNHERFAEAVRRDRIDILIDTGGHTANSRLLSFATKPAPVQVTWLGYPDTTGFASIDYRLTDAAVDPPGETERWHTEELVRLEGGFLCFRPPPDSPPAANPPFLAEGVFTFGSFNNMAKISPHTVRLWSAILRQAPQSRLALKNKALTEPEARERLLGWFAAEGIGGERLVLSGTVDSLAGHLDAYRRVDLALDTFPYHGTTTTCEAMWMGVPVVSLTGETHVSRVGLSLAAQVGLDEFAARSEAAYVELALGLAADPGELVRLRASLRERMRKSSLMDEAGFARKLERAYRGMWREWCATGVRALAGAV
jgi:predicted O-linked N-acetylglucosamine transferase (SPINDLY family)